MDAQQFDYLIRSVGAHSSRRTIVRRVAAGLGAVILGRATVETGEAQQQPNRCRNVGQSCRKRRGRPKPKCCAGATCHRNTRCRCRPGRKRCGNKCLKQNQCCGNNQCTGANAGNCVNNRCRAAFRTCTAGRGRVAFVSGPANPPNSKGSVRFTVGPEDATGDWAHLRFNEFAGVALEDITSLRYSVFVRPLNDGTCPHHNPYIALYVTHEGSEDIIVSTNFRPNPDGCNSWQFLDVASSAGRWWMPTNPGFAPLSDPRPLSDFIAEFPGIAIRNAATTDTQCPGAVGGLRLEAGEWPGGGGTGNSVSHVSFLRVATKSGARMFRF